MNQIIRGTLTPREYAFVWSVPGWSDIPENSKVLSQHFKGGNYQWIFHISKKASANPEHVGMYFSCDGTLPSGNTKQLKSKIKVDIALIPPRIGTRKPLIRTEYDGTFDIDKNEEVGYPEFISLKDVLNYLDNDTLNISIRIEEIDTFQLRVRPSPLNQTPIRFHDEKVSKFYDVTIRVFESEDETEDISNSEVFHSSKLILATVSSFFEDIFTSGMRESEEKEVILRGVDPRVFERILQFVHIGKVNIKDIEDSATILKEADKFMIERLTAEVVHYLRLRINCGTLWEIWGIADDYHCIELEDTCITFMKYNCKDVFADATWIDVKEGVAIKALQLNNIQQFVSEGVFFEAVIRWKHINTKKLKDSDNQSGAKTQYESEAERIENKILALQSRLNNIRIIQYKQQEDSMKRGQTHTDTPQDVSQLKQYTRKQRILEWKEENATLSQVDQTFAAMIYCVRFSQMDIDYIMNVVENNEDVLYVRGMNYLLREAYHYKLRKDLDNVDDALKSRFTKHQSQLFPHAIRLNY